MFSFEKVQRRHTEKNVQRISLFIFCFATFEGEGFKNIIFFSVSCDNSKQSFFFWEKSRYESLELKWINRRGCDKKSRFKVGKRIFKVIVRWLITGTHQRNMLHKFELCSANVLSYRWKKQGTTDTKVKLSISISRYHK